MFLAPSILPLSAFSRSCSSSILICEISRTFRMVQEVQRTVFRHGLAFYGTVAFVASFLGARLFATLNPTVTVVRGGIHFHHFWYGLAMVVSAGWLGITLNNERMGRNLAIVFGLGAGLIGDEVGLLLTFGDYTSNLTEIFFVAAVGFIILAAGNWEIGFAVLGLGVLAYLWGEREPRPKSLRSLAS